MATPRVSFASPPPSKPGDSSPASSVEDLDESTSSLTPAARAVFESLAHLVIAPERLTFVNSYPIVGGGRCDVYFAKLDETSQTPKDVAVERLRIAEPQSKDYLVGVATGLARQLKAWEGLRHPNVIELLGYYLSPSYHIAQLISPYKVNGGLDVYLAQHSVGIAQRLGFVRDITAGLDYLHGHSPPICHGDLTPSNITVDENLNAVLSCFGLASVCSDLDDPSALAESDPSSGTQGYMSPELFLGDLPKKTLACDVWAWACTTFEASATLENVLTEKHPFHPHKKAPPIFISIIKRESPGRPEMLLDLVPDAPKPEYASTLRLLHSYIPLCWEYEPRMRPSITLVRRQAFMFSFEGDVGNSVVATLEELAHLLIPPERLRLVEGSELGSGNYGEVVLGTLDEHSPNPRDVAVKRLKAVGTRGERVRLAKRLARELNIWAKIKHPNVVKLIGYYLDEKYESPLLISELMVNGNVLDYIERFKPDTEQRLSFVMGITAGLACLHNFDPPICHADLKPANVLIDLHMNAVLCDFGLASFVSGSGTSPGLVTSTTLKGSPRYMSPELLMEDDCAHSLESDVWAWGCTVFQVLTGYIPYAEAVGEAPFYLAIAQNKLPGDVALLLPSNSESADSDSALALRFLYSTLSQCWEFDPQKRPPICTLLSHISSPTSLTETEAEGTEDVAPRDSPPREGTSPLAKLENSHGERTGDDEAAQEDKQNVSTNASPGGEKVVGDDLEGDQKEVAGQEGAKSDELRDGDHGTWKNQAAEITLNRITPMTSTLTLTTLTLGVACILALGAILYRSVRMFGSLFRPDQKSTSPDYSSLKATAPPFSTLVLAGACIVSLCANIYQFVRKKESFTPRDQAAKRQTSLEQDS
ncbi:hypothetical protein M407DRAFT_28585 [Tulasnella calospora MUT 4182]|uniref:Protein kinase domain-containing protein n=1 Tax=Tulasnella calospora MUT 4182 TaxID=1051891 RepID=A0A0C3LKF8_9AGAM|nr:hypothetical protein M407DRAFT_28585 [Tulasnella calospora MUT 4182]